MRTKVLVSAVAAVLVGATGTVAAADGTGFQAGPFRVKPTIGLTFANDSNVTLASTNEISSFVTIVSPGVRLDSGNDVRSFSLSYEAELARYTAARAKKSDYTDHNLAATVRLSPSARTAIEAGAEYVLGHDRRGEGARQGLLAETNNLENDRWRATGGHIGATFGAPEGRFNFGLLGGLRNFVYRNNRAYSVRGDRDEQFLEGRVSYRLAPKTSVFLSARGNTIDFDRERTDALLSANNVSIDSKERNYFGGVQFDATAKLSGRIGVGRIRKNFDDARVSDYSGTGYEVGLQFRPRSYSVFDLSASRRTDEGVDFLLGNNVGLGLGNSAYLLANDVTLAWTHGWSDRLHTTVDIGREKSDYVNVRGGLNRQDNYDFWGLSADYSLTSWLSLGAGYKLYSRNADKGSVAANLGSYDYDRDEFLVSFEASL